MHFFFFFLGGGGGGGGGESRLCYAVIEDLVDQGLANSFSDMIYTGFSYLRWWKYLIGQNFITCSTPTIGPLITK